MKYAKKIVIIPYDRYQRLCDINNTSNVNENKQIESKSTVSLDPDIEKDKHQDEKVTDSYNLQDGDSQIKVEDHADVITKIPKYLKNRASLLLNHIINNTNIKWNEKGNILINDRVIENSHIVDLVRDAISPYNSKKRDFSSSPGLDWRQQHLVS